MTRFMDYMISPYPIRIIDCKVDASKLMVQSLRIAHVGHLPGRTQHRKNATFSKWALVYISGGQGSYQVSGGVKQRVEKGSLFWFYPGVTFHYGPESHGYWDEYYFSIEGPRLQEWLTHWSLLPGRVVQVGIDDGLQNKIDRIFMLMESGAPTSIDRAALLLESLLYEFMMNINEQPENNKTLKMTQIMEDISSFLNESIDAEKIAKRHHISVSTLRRQVSEYTGYPFNEYVHRLKIAEAKNILLNTELPIKDIALTLGYEDAFYFSRLFKQYVGVAPLMYRKHS
ncbi:AraC family transcriptional regulator [Paenibacillus agricola]|uniref:AraC family transcriptional regulator n=1 Tax=Paenibacillus agricola TaxID=2716264 RepID=A0ABX0IZM6_9BACL|nr:helix-turn-helix domain-containing protein [Paenibacillus agricola]NHN28264.1 AraC family transcriptional regulator [Paenibacillus agricola]